MPVGWGWMFSDRHHVEVKVVGRPRRDRSKNKSQRKARKRSR